MMYLIRLVILMVLYNTMLNGGMKFNESSFWISLVLISLYGTLSYGTGLDDGIKFSKEKNNENS